jgi:hypothetical protein
LERWRINPFDFPDRETRRDDEWNNGAEHVNGKFCLERAAFS